MSRVHYRLALAACLASLGGASFAQAELRGDGAQIAEASRFAGTEVYRVTVLSGRCQGTTGWVGAARIERAAAARSQ